VNKTFSNLRKGAIFKYSNDDGSLLHDQNWKLIEDLGREYREKHPDWPGLSADKAKKKAKKYVNHFKKDSDARTTNRRKGEVNGNTKNKTEGQQANGTTANTGAAPETAQVPHTDQHQATPSGPLTGVLALLATPPSAML